MCVWSLEQFNCGIGWQLLPPTCILREFSGDVLSSLASMKFVSRLTSIERLSLTSGETLTPLTSLVLLSLTSGETLTPLTSLVLLSLTSMTTASLESADFFLSSSQPRRVSLTCGCLGNPSDRFPICYDCPGPS